MGATYSADKSFRHNAGLSAWELATLTTHCKKELARINKELVAQALSSTDEDKTFYRSTALAKPYMVDLVGETDLGQLLIVCSSEPLTLDEIRSCFGDDESNDQETRNQCKRLRESIDLLVRAAVDIKLLEKMIPTFML